MKPRPATLPVFATERLRLRAMDEGDVDALFAIYGDAEAMQYASDGPFPEPTTVLTMLQSVGQLQTAGRSLEWGIVEAHTGILVGTCGLHDFDPATESAQVGCLLARNAWGKGYMREALGVVFDYAAKGLGLTRLRADIDAPNRRSLRLFMRLGFVPREGTIHELVCGEAVWPARSLPTAVPGSHILNPE